jgi:putative heme-binding domain-containing protein
MAAWITELVKLMAARLDTSQLAALVRKFEAESDKGRAYDLAQSLASGLERAGRKQQALFEPLFQSAAQSANSQTAPEQERLAAIKLLGNSSFERAKGLIDLLNPAETSAIQSTAIRTLGRFNDRAGNADLLAKWNSLTPSLRTELLDIMISRADRAGLLLKEVQAGKINSSDFSPLQLQALRTHPSDDVRKSADRLVAPPTTGSSRDQVIVQYRTALDLPGKAENGKTFYVERCASCHRAGGQGSAVGPDFASVKNSGKEKLLVNIIDPNREVPPQYLAYTAETKSGDIYTGILSAETSANISLLQPNGQRADLPRAQLMHFQSQKQSLMPEGLENGLSAQQMADLLAYILESQ